MVRRGDMPKFKEADFYYGSVLSMLFSNNITPVLIENDNDRQVYDYTTNKGEFRAFLKYRTSKKKVKKDNYNSWDFNFANDCDEIKRYIGEGKNVVLFLVCGSENFNESELAILSKEDIQTIFVNNKKTITISRQKHERAFRIAMGGGRSNSLPIKNNRFDEIF
jgi:hypothetical protein